jgi:hypothetical protein
MIAALVTCGGQALAQTTSPTTLSRPGGPGPTFGSTDGRQQSGSPDMRGGPMTGGSETGGSTMGGSMSKSGAYQQKGDRMQGGALSEEQVTECLNNAAASHRPLSSCRR